MQLTYVRYVDLAMHAGQIALPDDIGCVVGVPRSGMLPATMLATRLHVPLGMAGVNALSGGERMTGADRRGSRVLLVDDSVLTGRSMAAAKASLVRLGVPSQNIYTLAFYAHPDAQDKTDAIVMVVEAPRVFEWNLWNSVHTSKLLVDMDGVLCFDPEPFDDDGDEYAAALRDAKPRFLPHAYPVRGIVTNRIGKWRGLTEKWLARHGVRYETLTMQPHGTAAERRASSDPASFKAEHFARSEALLFVESHDHIATKLASLAHKPVLSVESNRIFSREAA